MKMEKKKLQVLSNHLYEGLHLKILKIVYFPVKTLQNLSA